MPQAKVIIAYFKRNIIIYGLLGLYFFAVLFNAAGIDIWLPECLITQYTGHECLGCGLNRAAIALVSGCFEDALSYNPLIFVYVPIIVFYAIYDFRKFYLQSNPDHYEQNQ